MSYAEPADLVARYDARTLGDLVSDAGVRVSGAGLLEDTKLQAALDDASGEIDASVLQANRYTTAQLAALTGNSLAYLKRICCQLAMAYLWERRPGMAADNEVAAEQAALQARKVLKELKSGEQIFDVDDVQEAGLPSVSTPSRVTRDDLNLAVNEARGRYYPAQRLPGE